MHPVDALDARMCTSDSRGPGSCGAPLVNYRVWPSRGPGGASRASMSFKMSHIEAKSINILAEI